ncbi:hypothetical protein ACWELJ_25935 [Nocardia sp. NPDC004582]
MADKKTGSGAVGARKLAREKMAAALESRRKREAANTADLESFYVASSRIDTATDKLDAAIEAAERAFAETEAAALDEQGEALRKIRERGTPQSELLEMTGLTAGELQKLLKRPAPTATATAAAPAAAVEQVVETESSEPADTTPPNVTPITRTAEVPADPATGDAREPLGVDAGAVSPVSAS